MQDVCQYAKYFIHCDPEAFPHTKNGSIRLQNLLAFADLVSYALYKKPLFEDNLELSIGGLSIGKVDKWFMRDYEGAVRGSAPHPTGYDDEEMRVLRDTMGDFGFLTDSRLIGLCYALNVRKYLLSLSETQPPQKLQEHITETEAFKTDARHMARSVLAYEKRIWENPPCIILNDITFYYNEEVNLTAKIFSDLEEFSKHCEDEAYTFYIDNGKTVIY